MREILFRGKRIDNGQWVYGVPVIGITSGVFMVWIESETKRGHGELSLRDVVKQAEVIPETVGQYTGLKDKNGKEIYEGDIVFANYDDEEQGVVVWDSTELEYGIDIGSVQMKMGCFYSRELEIIGNIHENPELLEVHRD